MTVRAHARRDLALVLRTACPEAENHHHALIEAPPRRGSALAGDNGRRRRHRSASWLMAYRSGVCVLVQLGIVVGGLRLGSYRRVDHLGVLADEDPPGPGLNPVEDDGRR